MVTIFLVYLLIIFYVLVVALVKLSSERDAIQEENRFLRRHVSSLSYMSDDECNDSDIGFKIKKKSGYVIEALDYEKK